MRKDHAEKATEKREAGKRMTLKEWQLTVFSYTPSSLWHDFFPKFIKANGLATTARLRPLLWQCIWELAQIEHKAMMDRLVAENRPTIRIGKRNILYQF